MPWEKIVRKTPNCRLDGGLPTPKDAIASGVEASSVYLCDDEGCGRRYVLLPDQREGGYYWEEIPKPPPV